MLPKEKRHHLRSTSSLVDQAVIEIKHSFGKKKKSVFQINEFDEHGLSFFIPVSEGYFRPGTPLEYTIKNGSERKKGFGIVRYYSKWHSKSGESFYKTGLQNDTRYRDVMGGTYTIRPERYKMSGKTYEKNITFTFSEKEYSFELIDVSRFSAAFACKIKDITLFRIGSVLSSVTIIVCDKILYEGKVTISHIYKNKGNRRVVIQPHRKTISVEKIHQLESVNSVTSHVLQLHKNHDVYATLDSEFKATVGDLRFFLEDYKKYLESPVIINGEIQDLNLINEIYDDFYNQMHPRITRLDDIVKKLKLSVKDNSVYKSYFQHHLHELLLLAPINHRSYYKPEGYPGDYEIMRMLHKNEFSGNTVFAKLIHKYTVDIPAASIAVKRTQYLTKKIISWVENSKKNDVRIFSIAAGPALEIDLLMKKNVSITNRLSLTLLDQEINALQFSQDQLYENLIHYGSSMRMEFIHRSIFHYLQDESEIKDHSSYDYIYAFGLFDYFNEEIARLVIKCLLPKINKGGSLLISNVSLDGHSCQTFAEYALEWYVVYRSKDELVKLINGVPGVKEYKLEEIDNGIMKFLEIKH